MSDTNALDPAFECSKVEYMNFWYILKPFSNAAEIQNTYPSSLGKTKGGVFSKESVFVFLYPFGIP